MPVAPKINGPKGKHRQPSYVTSADRDVMKAYAARDYVDGDYRVTDRVEINIPEYVPTVSQDTEHTEMIMTSGYFINENFPVTAETVYSAHCLELPLAESTYCPVRFHKGAEFLLYYPTGKIEEGYLIYMKDKEEPEEVDEF